MGDLTMADNIDVPVRNLTPEEADVAHARSCACGDRAGHEAEEGSDYTIPSVELLD